LKGFCRGKGKIQAYLIKPMNHGQEKALMGLEKKL
jgi:hypothetical protein